MVSEVNSHRPTCSTARLQLKKVVKDERFEKLAHRQVKLLVVLHGLVNLYEGNENSGMKSYRLLREAFKMFTKVFTTNYELHYQIPYLFV